MTTEWKTVALFPIPSVIYLIHNNVQFATLTYVDTSTYQIMGNLKIVTTGVLFRCLMFQTLDFRSVSLISQLVSDSFFFFFFFFFVFFCFFFFFFSVGCFWVGDFLTCSGWLLCCWLSGQPLVRCQRLESHKFGFVILKLFL